MIATARKQYPELSQKIATINEVAFRRYYRESNIGNLVADLMREEAGSDIAMMSSGSTRVDLNKGPVTVENVTNVFPFTDTLNVVKISGKQLDELLEYSYTLPYGLAQFSGIEARYDSQRPEGDRLLSLTVNGKPVNMNEKYTHWLPILMPPAVVMVTRCWVKEKC